jgi:hypothetical protein
MLRALAGVAVTALAAVGPAGAATAAGPFDPAVEIGPGGGPPAVAMTSRGDAMVAWAPQTRMCGTGPITEHGVWVSWRPAGGGPWLGPVRIHAGPAFPPALAVNERGDAVVAWLHGSLPENSCTESAPDDLQVRVLSGGAWGPVETVPRPPEPSDAAQSTRLHNDDPRVAIGPDGTVAVAWRQFDWSAAGDNRAFAALRAAGGGFGPPQLLAEADRPPDLAQDANGTFTVALLTDAGMSGSRPTGRIALAERQPGAPSFGPTRPVATSTAYDAEPELAVNRRGDGLVTWGDGAVHRPAGGAWGDPEPLHTWGRTTSALNERGDAMVTWPGPNLSAQFRPAGGAFGPVAHAPLRDPDSAVRNAAALDARGTAVVLQRIDQRGRNRRLAGYLRFRDGPFAPPVDATPRGLWVLEPRFATDAFDNGVLAYSAYLPGNADRGAVAVVDYSASPPRLSDVVALPGAAFRFRLSEPARVRLSVWRGRTALGGTRSRAGAGVNRMAAPAALRRRLTPGRRYVARLRAYDAGRRASRTVAVRFRAGGSR